MQKEYNLEPSILPLSFKGEDKASRPHKQVIRDLVRHISLQYDTPINYDHVYSTVKRSPLPMKYKGKRYDIAFIHGNRLILVQIDTIDLRKRSPRKVKGHAKSEG